MQDQNIVEKYQKALVIGGGVGGIQVSLEFAKTGRDVALIDKAPSIGGLMTRLDRTFPTNNCDLCTLSPNLSESGRQDHIELLTMTELVSLAGEPGNFEVMLKTKPRHIDTDKCTVCGDCFREFKECVRFTPGLLHGAPTCMRYPQSTPLAYSIDIEKCRDIEELSRVCEAGAIIADDKEKIVKMKVGAVVIATGADMFDISALDNFGGGAYPNVVTGLEYERIMSASGPTSGALARPSDGKTPKKIAWIQCVGSRGINRNHVSYCSSVCCMYALKEAIITKERFKNDIETTIFYMDMRTFGKDYEAYRNRAENDCNIKLVQSRPHSVIQEDETKDLELSFILDEKSALQTEKFDMVVLATGFRMPKSMNDLAEKLGVRLNSHNFVETSDFSPAATSRPGIYVCGVSESPKDIPETIIQASAAVSLAHADLGDFRKTAQDRDEAPPERDVTGESPRIGVFVCGCGMNIGGVINVEDVAARAKNFPDVVLSEAVGYGCSVESLKYIQAAIVRENLNRIVIGGCSPRTHETKFQDAIRMAGLNRYLLEMANIRDQNTWVHKDRKSEAGDKALDLIRMAAGRVAPRRPLADHLLPSNKNVLVVGGGVAGMTAGLSLADQGFKVYIVERSPKLGGIAANIRKTLSGKDARAYVEDLIKKTLGHERVEVLTDSIIVDHKGMPGMFTTGMQSAPGMRYRQIEHGVTIMASGAAQNRPHEYLLDEHPGVVTQYELDSIIEDHPDRVKAWKSVVMIQCVGSRTEENPACSRVCCQSAIKNALRIIENNPKTNIYIFYRDIRTPGFQEDYYIKARKKGVVFLKYEIDGRPLAKPDAQGLTVVGKDHVLGQNIEIKADCLVLSSGMAADDEGSEDLATIFNLNRTSDGYFLEDHVKLRPTDLSTPGFMVAGAAHGPKTIRETITQAQAAAGRALTFLAKETINLGACFAKVDPKKCASCLICVRACPYDIPFINAEGYSEIDPAKCHGCGACASECPAKAIQLTQCEDDMISAELDGLFRGLRK